MFVYLCPSKCLLICLHFDITSFRRFRSPFFSAVMIWYFSDVHKLHLLAPHLRAGAFCRIFQVTVCSMLLSLRDHIFLDNSVLLQYFLFRKDDQCVFYRVLKSPSHSPMYLKFSVLVYTSASYTRDVCMQSPFRGHVLVFLHEQAFLLSAFALKDLAFWLFIIIPMFGIHE